MDIDEPLARLRTEQIYPYPDSHLFNKIAETVKQSYIDGISVGNQSVGTSTPTLEAKLTLICQALTTLNSTVDKLTNPKPPSHDRAQSIAEQNTYKTVKAIIERTIRAQAHGTLKTHVEQAIATALTTLLSEIDKALFVDKPSAEICLQQNTTELVKQAFPDSKA